MALTTFCTWIPCFLKFQMDPSVCPHQRQLCVMQFVWSLAQVEPTVACNGIKPSATESFQQRLAVIAYTYLRTSRSGFDVPRLHKWSGNKVRELIAVEVLHTSLLNIIVVAFKVLPLGSYALMPVPSPPFKTISELVLWNALQNYLRITIPFSVIKVAFSSKL
jgi:hypothetical protein